MLLFKSPKLWVSRIMPHPKDALAIIPGTCEPLILHDKRDFTGAIKLRILKPGDYPGGSNIRERQES